MEATSDRPSELERHLDHQMRAQERQLAWARLGMAALAAAALLLLARDAPELPVILGVLGSLAVLSLLTPFLLRHFPAREVGIVSTVVEMAAVTVAVYVVRRRARRVPVLRARHPRASRFASGWPPRSGRRS